MKKFNYAQFEEEIDGLASFGAIEDWQGFGPGHYRLDGYLDVWPRRKRFMNMDTGKHGTYNSLKELLNPVDKSAHDHQTLTFRRFD